VAVPLPSATVAAVVGTIRKLSRCIPVVSEAVEFVTEVPKDRPLLPGAVMVASVAETFRTPST